MTPDRHISANRRGLIKAVGASYNGGGAKDGGKRYIYERDIRSIRSEVMASTILLI